MSVGGRSTSKIVALHHSLKTLTLGSPNDIHPLAIFEKFRTWVGLRQLLTLFEAKLTDDALGRNAMLLEVTHGRLLHSLLLLIRIGHLNGAIPIFGIRCFLLHELIASHIDHGNRDRTASLLVKEPGHTYFLSNQS
jgi:hypothetical protein